MPQTVLVVEDETKIRELLRSYLEREGYQVVTTGSGAEGITDVPLNRFGAPSVVPGSAFFASVHVGDWSGTRGRIATSSA